MTPHRPPDVLRHRAGDAPGPLVPLRAGPLAARFDAQTGWLRRVTLGGREVLRAVYGAVRDRYWRTPANRLRDLTVRDDGDSFAVEFDADCRLEDVDYTWHGTIRGVAGGTITYRFAGRANAPFLRSRIGLCVLHPIRGCAGRPCVVEHPDGTTEHATFPDAIAPHQPFHNIRAMTHAVADGVTAEVRFDGEVFETEDQRNWTDASFKTYGTPLSEPRPVKVKPGDRVEQTVTLRLLGEWKDLSPPELNAKAKPTSRLAALPRIGFGVADRDLTPGEIDRLRALRPDHLRVDVAPGAPDAVDRLRRAAGQARAVGTVLHVALLLGDAPEAGLPALAAVGAPVAAWLVARGPTGTGTAAGLAAARRLLPPARFGVGTNGYFTELNRQRPPSDGADFVFFSVNPQVHAFDDLSLMETLDGQQWVVENARRIAGGRPVAVTPVTLRPRFNPHAVAAGVSLPAEPDPRMATAFAAAWTAGSVRRLAAAGVESATYFDAAAVLGSPAYRTFLELARQREVR